ALGIAPMLEGFLLDRFRLPQPRLNLGASLVGLASAAMDISDGLVADLRHLCDASEVGAELEAASLPLSEGAKAALAVDPNRLALVLGGGDDYELLFTAPDSAAREIAGAAAAADVPATPIGRIVAGQGVRVRDPKGAELAVGVAGYAHF
ncbi:MAG: thiamine-phosphate kinase, partial [Stellaceae bacterium]